MIDLMWYESETELNTHPFVLLLLSKQAEIGKKLEKLERKGMKTSLETVRISKEFSKEEKTALEVHLLLQEVHFKIDRIQQCHIMLDFYPQDIRAAWFTPMSRGEYIEQVMELYAMHSIGLIDRVLILYNYIFDLKLKRRDRTVLNITRKLPKEDGFPLFAFSMIFKEIRKSRNSIAHEYRFIDNDLIDLVLKDSFARDEYRASMPEAQKIFAQLDKQYDKKVKELRKNMGENDSILTERYLPVIEVVERQYQKMIHKR